MSQFDSIRFQGSRPLLKEVTADRLNAILSEIRRNKPKGERGITVRHSGDATYIGLAKNFQGSTTTATRRLPWDIYVSETDESGDYTVKVEPGLISGVLASNYQSDFENIAQDTLYYGVVDVSTDGEFITGASIVIKNTEPEEQIPTKFGLPSSVEILFGLFINGVSQNVTNGTLNVRATNVLAVPSSSPVVGSPPFDVYYLLQ